MNGPSIPFLTARRAMFPALILTAILVLTPQKTPLCSEENLSGTDSSGSSPTTVWRIPQGRYLYKFTWNGIPSAESEVTVSMEEEEGRPCYLIKGTARTSRLADLFWRFRASIEAVVNAVTGKAEKIRTSERTNSRLKETETAFFYDSAEAVYSRRKKGKVKEKKIALEGDVIDPASLGLILSYERLEVGDSAKFTVLYGDDRYALEYEVTGREEISAAGKHFNTLRLEPRIQKLDEQEEKKEDPPKVSQMTVWLSEERPRIPVRMRSKTFIGHVTGQLSEIKLDEPHG